MLAAMRARLQRRPRRIDAMVWAGNDPTTSIASLAEAAGVAEALLECVPRKRLSDGYWHGVAVRPLAALLYASALLGERGGIAWAHRAVDNIYSDATAPGWYQAIELCRSIPDAAAARAARDLLTVASLSSRQRASICVMMRAATAPRRPWHHRVCEVSDR